jgi:hypothetical protein
MFQARGRLYVVGRGFKSPAPEASFPISGFHIVRMKVSVVAECGATGFESVLPEEPVFKRLPVLRLKIREES